MDVHKGFPSKRQMAVHSMKGRSEVNTTTDYGLPPPSLQLSSKLGSSKKPLSGTSRNNLSVNLPNNGFSTSSIRRNGKESVKNTTDKQMRSAEQLFMSDQTWLKKRE